MPRLVSAALGVVVLALVSDVARAQSSDFQVSTTLHTATTLYSGGHSHWTTTIRLHPGSPVPNDVAFKLLLPTGGHPDQVAWSCTSVHPVSGPTSGTTSTIAFTVPSFTADEVLACTVDVDWNLDWGFQGKLIANLTYTYLNPGLQTPNTLSLPFDGGGDTLTMLQVADVEVHAVELGPLPQIPGQSTNQWQAVITNLGPSRASIAPGFGDPFGAIGVTRTCTTTGGGGCSGIIAVGETVTWTMQHTWQRFAQGTPLAFVTVPAISFTVDPDGLAEGRCDVPLSPHADTSITMTGPSTVDAGGTAQYQLTLQNPGPSDDAFLSLGFPLFANITNTSWTCSGTCSAASGSGLPNFSGLYFPYQASAVYTVTTTAPLATPPNTVWHATATISSSALGGSKSATVNTAVNAIVQTDFSVTTSLQFGGQLIAGAGGYTQSVSVKNLGTVFATARVTVPMPATLFQCQGTCPYNANGDLQFDLSLQPGATQTFQVSGALRSSAPEGTFTPSATVAALSPYQDTNAANNSATTAVLTLKKQVSLSATMSNDVVDTIALDGQTINTTADVRSFGPSDTSLRIVHRYEAAFGVGNVTWTCVGTGCPAASGVGDLDVTVPFANGASASFAFHATIAEGASGNLVERLTLSGAGVTTTNRLLAAFVFQRISDVSVSDTLLSAPVAIAGADVTSRDLMIFNQGDLATPVHITSAFGPDAAGVSVWCESDYGRGCPLVSTGDIDEDVVMLPYETLWVHVSNGWKPSALGIQGHGIEAYPVSPWQEINPVDNSAVGDPVTLVHQSHVTLTKSASAVVTAGQRVDYTITATNDGPSDARGVHVVDVLPAAFTSGTGLDASVDLAAGATRTFTVSGTLALDVTGNVTNSVSCSGDDITCTGASATSSVQSGAADISVSSALTSSATAIAGLSLSTHRFTVENFGPAATRVRVTSPFPSAASGATWTCTATSGASCDTPSGVGNVDVAVTLPVGKRVFIDTTNGWTPAAEGSFPSVATATLIGGEIDPITANNVDASAAVVVVHSSQIALGKTVDRANAAAGDALVYTVVVRNDGPSDADAVHLVDVLPAAFASGASLDETFALALGASRTFTVSGTLALSAGGTVTNTASVSGDGITTTTASASTAVEPRLVDLSIDDVLLSGTTAVAGQDTSRYRVTVTNHGPAVTDAHVVADGLDVTVHLAVGASQSFDVERAWSASATGSYTHVASVSALAPNLETFAADNVAAAPTVTLAQVAHVTLTKDDGLTSAAGGDTLVYVITARNDGPSDDAALHLVDVLPAGFASGGGLDETFALAAGATRVFSIAAALALGTNGPITNTVTASSPASDAADGVTPASDTTVVAARLVDLSVSDTLLSTPTPVAGQDTSHYRVSVTNHGPGASDAHVVAQGLDTVVHLAANETRTFDTDVAWGPSASGTYTHSVTVTALAPSLETDNANNIATAAVVTLVQEAHLVLTKSDGLVSAAGGDTLSYLINAHNAGPSDDAAVHLVDVLPAGFSSGTGLDETFALPAGTTRTFTVDATLALGTDGPITNTVSASSAASTRVGGVAPASDTTTVAARLVDLSVSDTLLSTQTPVAGRDTSHYRVAVTNHGPGASDAHVVAEGLDVVVHLAANETRTFDADVAWGPSANGTYTHSVTVTALAPSLETNNANNVATAATVTLVQEAHVTLAKSDGLTTAAGGDTLVYMISAHNDGPSDDPALHLVDVLPAGFTSGTGLDETVALAAGATRMFTVTATLDLGTNGAVTNTVNASSAATARADGVAPASDTTVVAARLVDLGVSDTLLSPATAIAGLDTSHYRVSVLNRGPGASDAHVVAQGLDTVVHLAANETRTFDADVAWGPSANGSYTHSVTVTALAPSLETNNANNVATAATVTLVQEAHVTLAKSDGLTTAAGGDTLVYMISAHNDGPSDDPALHLVDVLPAGFTSGTGLDETFALAAGATRMFTVTATLGLGTDGAVTNTVNASSAATARADGVAPASDTTLVAARLVDLAVSDTLLSPATAIAGLDTSHYRVSVLNRGPGASDAHVVAQGLDTVVHLAANETRSFDVDVAWSPSASGTYTHSVTVTALAPSLETNNANNAATAAAVILQQRAHITLGNSDGLTRIAPGATALYTLTIHNDGPSDDPSLAVQDLFAAQFASVVWTCSGACPSAAGSGAISTTLYLPAGATTTYRASAQLDPAARGVVSNTLTSSSVASGVTSVVDQTTIARANGETCGGASDCESGFCIDGMCCNGSCGDGICVAGACRGRYATEVVYDGDNGVANGAPVELAAVLFDHERNLPLAGKTLVFVLGQSASAQSCSAVTDPTGTATCTIAAVTQVPDADAEVDVTVTFAGDHAYLPAADGTTLTYEYMIGRAYGVSGRVSILGGATVINPTPDTGTIRTAGATTTAPACISGPFGSKVLCPKVVTTRGPSKVVSTSTVASFSTSLGALLPSVSGKALAATATATCAGASGATTSTRVTLGGTGYQYNWAPNTVLPFPGFLGIRVVVNEQLPVAGADAGLTVNALHVTVTGLFGTEIILGSTTAAIYNCR